MTGDQPNLIETEATEEQQAAQTVRDAEREVYRARLAEKLKDPEFRKIEGFPIGTDEAILALSDPPYYTACPNPFLEEWLAENAKPYDPETDDYHCEPFAADVSEGKNDPIYNAHSYHTKVPHKAIMRYILHYTEPGDVVYDGFCGTGMTGVAAQMCGNKAQVESLGYTVKPDGAIVDGTGQLISQLGARKAVLNDLSPAATFIAYNYNTPVDAPAFERDARRILKEVEADCGWMYSTLHDASDSEALRVQDAIRRCGSAEDLRTLFRDLKKLDSPLRDRESRLQIVRATYILWSDVFVCPVCGTEVVFWDAAVDTETLTVTPDFACQDCGALIAKSDAPRATTTRYDTDISDAITSTKRVPVLVNYTAGRSRVSRRLNQAEVQLCLAIDTLQPAHWYPTDPMMRKGDRWGDLWRAGYHIGFTHTHHFFTRRNLYVLAALYSRAAESPFHRQILFALTSFMVKTGSLLHNVGFKNGSINLAGAMPLVLYVPSIIAERNILDIAAGKVHDLLPAFVSERQQDAVRLETTSTTRQPMPCEGVDYIFTDPPFGGNIMYSELNFLWESWLKVSTNVAPEAICNDAQSKFIHEYQSVISRCFSTYFAVLKPGRWLTVEFHNSSNAIWNCIQEAFNSIGFVVADVRVLDKGQGTFKQMTTAGAVKQDLVISCYKPRTDFEERFATLKGRPEGVADFIRQHLAMLPVAPVTKANQLENTAERTRFLLFDRMVAYHLQRGAPIPMSAADFYLFLRNNFPERDGMYFLPDQAARYDAARARGMEAEQFSIFVQDERSAVLWIRAQLAEKPQTLGDLTTEFLQELHGNWPKHEPRPELRDVLRENFVEENGVWRVPDENSEKDLEALRKASLLRLFKGYAAGKAPLKEFRTEAVLEGFRHCWQTSQFGTIVSVCERIPVRILQDIHELVQFYDIAKTRAPETVEQAEFVWE